MRFFFILTLALLPPLSAAPSFAQAGNGLLSPADEIRSTLLSHGYIILEDERTWLGRQRILAQKGDAQRELVFIPGTGEVLRDYSAWLGEAIGGSRTSEGYGATGSASPSISVGDTVGNGRSGSVEPDISAGLSP